MRPKFVVAACALAVACWISPGIVSADEANLPKTTATPADLVRAALKTELGGPSDLRKTLLDEALKLDPDFAPARWHLGFVRRDGEWLTIDQLTNAASRDGTLSAYCKLRDQLVSTAENQMALAKWCRKNKLGAEERIHWAKVLEFEPNNDEALNALGLQVYEGQLLTKQQIEQKKHEAGERQRAMRHWQAQLVKWRAAIESGSEKQRAIALDKLRTLNDPEAIAALDAVFSVNANSKKSTELNLLLVDAVGHMPQQEATNALLRRAVVPESKEVRMAATSQLKKRPMRAFVPQLLAALAENAATLEPGQFEWIFEFGFMGHSAYYVQEIHYHDANNDFYALVTHNFGSVMSPQALPSVVLDKASRVSQSLAIANERAAQATAEGNAQRRVRKSRIEAVIAEATSLKNVGQFPALMQQWQDYNESYALPSMGTGIHHNVSVESYYQYTQYSCFTVGTPVCTFTGPTPIEKIQPGDRVLAQDPATGELAYKTVQAATLRPPAKMIEIGLGSETIRATRGHPFWVNGKGWLMAKQLKIGDVLHSLKGAVVIDNLQEAPAKEAYNLVVSDFDTYFVGDQQILVHDNLPLQDTSVIVPGLLVDSDLQAAK